MHYWYGPFDRFGNFSFGGITMMILFVAVIAVVIYLLVRNNQTGHGDGRYHSEQDALEILKNRFAKGEIDEAEYRRVKDELLS